MKWTSSLLLLLLAVLLAAFVFFYERHQPTTEEAAGRGDRLFDIEAEAIEWIELDRDGTLVRLERRTEEAEEAEEDEDAEGDRTWRVTSPLDDRADSFLVDSLADRIAGLESTRLFDETAPPPPDDESGLDPPRLRLTLEAGEGPVTLLAGRDAPGTGGVYLRVETDGSTHLVGSSFVDGLDRPVDEWRDPTLFDLSTLDLAGATIVRPATDGVEGTIRFERRGEDWWLAAPIDDEARGSRVQSLLSSVVTLRAEAFHREEEVSAVAGLDKPTHSVSLSLRGGKEAGEIRFGTVPAGAADRVFAGVTDRPGIFEVNDRVLEDLAEPVSALRSMKLVTIGEFAARKMTIESGGRAWSFEKVDGEWTVTDPPGTPVRDGAIEQTLRELAGLEAEEILGPADDPAAAGLDQPAARAEIVSDDTPPRTQVLRLGGSAPGEGLIHAMREGRPFIFSVSASILERFGEEAYAPPPEVEPEEDAEGTADAVAEEN